MKFYGPNIIRWKGVTYHRISVGQGRDQQPDHAPYEIVLWLS